MKLFGSMVMKNESPRYLEACIRWNRRFVDELFVFDDQSDDDSVEIAWGLGAKVVVRDNDAPSFLEHEGEFRQNAWWAFEEVCRPTVGDWVFSFDADEFAVAPGEIRNSFDHAINRAQRFQNIGVILPFPEIFNVDTSGQPFQRVDGYWGSIRGPRLFMYRDGGVWQDKTMGCGSEPTYVSKGSLSTDNAGINVLHYGYAQFEDRSAKYERYNSLAHGHNDKHIQSILQQPQLVRWDGVVPEVLT